VGLCATTVVRLKGALAHFEISLDQLGIMPKTTSLLYAKGTELVKRKMVLRFKTFGYHSILKN
jgi:hypothetical protein